MFSISNKFNIVVNASAHPMSSEFASGPSLRYPTTEGQTLPFLRNSPVYQIIGDPFKDSKVVKIPVSDDKRETDIVTKSFGPHCALVIDSVLALFEAERAVKNAKTSAQRNRATAQANKLLESATGDAKHFPLNIILRANGRVYISGKGWEGKHTISLKQLVESNSPAALLVRDHAVQGVSEQRVREELIKQLSQITLIDVEAFYDEYAGLGSEAHGRINADAIISAAALFNVVRDLRAGEYGLSEYMVDYLTDVATLQQRVGDVSHVINTATIPVHFHEVINNLSGSQLSFSEGIFALRLLSDYWREDATMSADGPRTSGEALFFPDVTVVSSDESQIIFRLPAGTCAYRVEHHGYIPIERVKVVISAFVNAYASAFKAMWARAPAIMFKQIGVTGIVVSPVVRL